MPFSKWVLALWAAAWLAWTVVPAAAQGTTAAMPEPPTVPQRVEAAYRYGDFAELERLYALYGKAGVRSELTGASRVRHFWMGIRKVNDPDLGVTDDYYQQLDLLTGQWARTHPLSVLAQLLHAHSLMTHAWVYRGHGYTNTVSPAAWAGFRKYLDLAAADMARSEALAANDSSWNWLMLEIGLGLEWDKRRLAAVFEAGIAKNPDHDDLYFAMQTALLPRWGGDLAAVDRLIALAVKNTREKRGLEMYALLYAAVSHAEVHQTLFTASVASWPSMKSGFEDLLRRYPHVDHRNLYAYFACMADDRPVLQEQLALIGDQYQSAFWGNTPERTFEACKKVAQAI